MRYTHVALDIDGTLIDSTAAIRSGLQMFARDRLGRELDAVELARCMGLPASESIQTLGLGGTPEDVAQWVGGIMESYGEVYVFDGVEHALAKLHAAGVVMGAVTSEDRYEYEHGFSRFGLAHYLACAITVEETEGHKPGPAPLLEFVRRTGANAATTLYVGDSTADVACANAAGIDVALACWKPGALDVTEGVVARLASPADLLGLVL